MLGSGGRAVVSVQNPLRLTDADEPQPDLVLFRWRDDVYRTGDRPTPADVLLVVEVADTSLSFDRTTKLDLCARAGIPDDWTVDLQRRVVITHRTPAGDRFDEISTLSASRSVSPVTASDIVIDVGRILS